MMQSKGVEKNCVGKNQMRVDSIYGFKSFEIVEKLDVAFVGTNRKWIF